MPDRGSVARTASEVSTAGAGLFARLKQPKPQAAWVIGLISTLVVAGSVKVERLPLFRRLIPSRSPAAACQNRCRLSWRRSAIAGLVVVALFAGAGCTGGEKPSAGPRYISYAGAADQLSGLDPLEAGEQLRDWARTGLASLLELDTAQLRDAAYDTVPVRDPAFIDLAEQPTGPGRALFDGRGVLHVLVPRNDPYEARTIGLLLDDFRAAAGADAQQVSVHHYRVHPERLTIELTSAEPAANAEVRAAHGYVERRIDLTDGLVDFLAQTQHLSWVEARGSEIWAGGWHWPGVPGAQLTFEDISVIQRSYRGSPSDPPPGFSLDPGPPESADDVRALLPDLRPELADRLAAESTRQPERPLLPEFRPRPFIPPYIPRRPWPEFTVTGSPSATQSEDSGFLSTADIAKMVKLALFGDDPELVGLSEAGLPSDRTQLWALQSLLDDLPMYSQARYDGRLKGTEVGMTLFYTDFVAKDWTNGVGAGVPADAVDGFVPDPDAVNPWSHCGGPDDPLSEYGRLWFGQSESGFTFDDDGVSIGARATRLFARSEGDDDTEVERSFAFGRGLRWWDQHYQEIADYEPQYHRLDQIMRWSGALEWLVSQTGLVLPQLDDAAIRSDLRFQDWYAANNDLRERSPIAFVRPPSATQEAILAKPSKTHKGCGFGFVSGGVSFGDLTRRKGGRSYRADLPEAMQRSGLTDSSNVDAATGTGRIKKVSLDGNGQVVDSLERTISLTPGRRAIVQVVGDGRRVASYGDLKVWRAQTAPRRLTVEIEANAGEVAHGVRFEGVEQGQLTARKIDAFTTTVQWRSGPGDRLRRALESVQDRLTSAGGAGPAEPTDGVLFGYDDGAGRTVYEIGDKDGRVLSLTKEVSPPGEETVFRLGAPNAATGLSEFLYARLVPRPNLQGPWLEVAPATPGSPARVTGVAAPGPGARAIRVKTADDSASTINQAGDRLWVAHTDPILGWSGSPEGAALLRDFPKVEAEMRAAAAQNRPDLASAVRLGREGMAFAYADRVVITAMDHPWAERALRAYDPANPERAPLIRIKDDQAIHVDPGALTTPGPGRRAPLREVAGEKRDLYLREDLRAQLTLEEGVLLPDAVPRRLQVVVREAVAADSTSSGGPASRPDARVHEGWEWFRVNGSVPGGSGGGGPGPAPSGPPQGVQQVILVCPAEEGADTVECEQ